VAASKRYILDIVLAPFFVEYKFYIDNHGGVPVEHPDRRETGPRGWFGNDYSNLMQDIHVPVLTHEIGEWCAYPDFDVIKKFTGYLRPGNYEIFRDSAAAHGVALQRGHGDRGKRRDPAQCDALRR
jgi:hypothetical protein